MRKYKFLQLFIGFILWSLQIIYAQENHTQKSLAISDFEMSLQILASDDFEGREAGTIGAFKAANYISILMQQYGLLSYCDSTKNNLNSYFQNFKLLKYANNSVRISLLETDNITFAETELIENIDFKTNNLPYNLNGQLPVVFAGYGINNSTTGYNDYFGLDVKNKIVVILDGFPGENLINSVAGLKYRQIFSNITNLNKLKISTAKMYGASAVIIIDTSKYFIPETTVDYADNEYIPAFENKFTEIPVIKITKQSGERILKSDFENIESIQNKISNTLKPCSKQLKNSYIKLNYEVNTEIIKVANIIGFVKGTDTTKNIVIGAHYDHLGKRNGTIFRGADDNASGVSGLLALAKKYGLSELKPKYNIVFAAWTAEEKGLIGSNYFVNYCNANINNTILYINMDMISRSASEDTLRNQLSIGIRTVDTKLREITKSVNSKLSVPFILDLWDVTGHSGSDYGSFINKNIPVLTFNSGLHNDYHTTRDTPDNVDFIKMKNILLLVDEFIKITLNSN